MPVPAPDAARGRLSRRQFPRFALVDEAKADRAISGDEAPRGGSAQHAAEMAVGLLGDVTVVDRSVKAADLVRAAQSVDRKLITQITVFDLYEGEGIAPGKKSIAIAVTLQPRDKTMTDQEIDAVAAKIVAEVAKRTGGTLRA